MTETFFTFRDVLGDEHGINTVVVYNLWGVTVDLIYFSVIITDSVDYRDDLTSCVVELLQIRCFFHQFCPKLLVQFGRLEHCLLTERNMIIKANDLDEVIFLILILL